MTLLLLVILPPKAQGRGCLGGRGCLVVQRCTLFFCPWIAFCVGPVMPARRPIGEGPEPRLAEHSFLECNLRKVFRRNVIGTVSLAHCAAGFAGIYESLCPACSKTDAA